MIMNKRLRKKKLKQELTKKYSSVAMTVFLLPRGTIEIVNDSKNNVLYGNIKVVKKHERNMANRR